MEPISNKEYYTEKSKDCPDKKLQAGLEWKWWTEGSLGVGQTSEDLDSDKIAMFDMDGTIIDTKSKKSNPINSDDWVLWNDCIPKKLQEVKNAGYRIVIISNQKGISLGYTTLKEIQTKIEKWSASVGVEMSVLLATENDQYRKPLPGSWEYIQKTLNKTPIEKSKCFYVGDAAGRPKIGKRPKDHSDCDRFFSINCGLNFFTPESYFLGHKEDLPELPKTFVQLHKSKNLFKGEEYHFDPSRKDSNLIVTHWCFLWGLQEVERAPSGKNI